MTIGNDLNQGLDQLRELGPETFEFGDLLERVHDCLAAGLVIVGHQEVGQHLVTGQLVDPVLGAWDRNQIAEHVKCVSLQLNKLGLGPPRQDDVVLASLRVKHHEKRFEKAFFKSNGARLLRELASQNLEDLGPKEFFQLKVFFGLRKNGSVAGLLVVDGVFDHLIKDASAVRVLLKEVLVALTARDDKVHQDADLVSEALVILLVATLHHFVELTLERWDCFGVARQVSDRHLTAYFDQIPQGFNGERNDVGAEVLRLVDDADEVAADTELNNVLSDWLVVADSCKCF